MPKIRVYELAKELSLSNKEVISKLVNNGVIVTNHMSSLDDSDANRLRDEARYARAPRPVKVPAQKETSPEKPPVEGEPKFPPIKETPDSPPKSLEKVPKVDVPASQVNTPNVDSSKIIEKPRGETESSEGTPRPRPPLGPDGKPMRPRLGPDGKPLSPRLDAEGKPLPIRPRLGPDGKPLPPRLGPNGKPLPPRPRLGPDGKPLPPRPRLGPDGKPLPPRLGPDGKPLPPRPRPLGPDGKPIPPRPRLGPDGKPLPPRLGPDGKPLPRRPRPMVEESRPMPAEAAPTIEETTHKAAPETKADPPEVVPETQERVLETKPIELPQGAEEKPQQRIMPQPRPATGDRPPRDGQRPPRDGQQRPPRDGQRPPFNRPQGAGTGQRPDTRPPRDGQRPGGPPREGQRPGSGPRPGFAPGSRPPGRPAPGGRPPAPGGRPAGPGGRPPAPGGRPPGPGGSARPAPGRGAPPARGEVKKTEPTKDDKRVQWTRQQQALSIKRDKGEAERKENRQGLDRRSTRGSKPVKKVMPVKVQPTVTIVTVAAEITVRDLAEKLMRSNSDVIKVLMKKGVMVTANQTIDFEMASHVAESFGVLVDEYVEVDVFEEAFSKTPDEEGSLLPRPPVVVVMGHVDHGKTSLLDVIRNANVQQSEAGGITQHIGAYSVEIHDKKITFLDTPGHEAFTAMRMRGAQVTDIAIVVVAADDGVMPQTIEAINHAKAAEVDIVVAITMMDKPDANPDRARQQLTDQGLQPEEWGGATITVPVSAREKMGIEQLLEMILLVAEMKELKANPDKPARGSIIEAKLDKGRGPVATVLVQEGTLKVGDPVVAGACFGKVRAMVDSRGRSVKEAGPSMPVEIIGMAEVPATGDILYAAQSDKQARQLSETVVAKGRESLIKTGGKVSLDELFSQIQAGQVKDLNIVVKADVQGSVEALRGSLNKLTNEEVRVRIIHTGVGAISESDVMLASASNAIILGFNVRPDAGAKSVAETENVDVRLYSVIYSAIDDIEAAMKGMLDPEFREKVLGQAEIRQLFKASGIGTIGGSYVTDGRVTRNAQVRIVRDGRVIYDGYLDTLRRFKDDVREVASGYECGMLFRNYNDIKEGDKVEAYIMEEIPR